MRPVERPASTRVWADYTLAKEPLTADIGNYCSYCERIMPDDVEHILPKSKFPLLRTDWSNFLLACKSCNGIKNKHQLVSTPPHETVDRNRYLWPHIDNTARAFVYTRTGISVQSGLPPSIDALASLTCSLTGFNRQPGTTSRPKSVKDLRWKYRDDVWVMAGQFAVQLQAEPTNLALREMIPILAAAKGFWSVWRAVFSADTDMLSRLNAAFKGTDPSSFDASFQPVPRPGGQL